MDLLQFEFGWRGVIRRGSQRSNDQKLEHNSVGKCLGTNNYQPLPWLSTIFNFASKSKAIRKTCAGTAGLVGRMMKLGKGLLQ